MPTKVSQKNLRNAVNMYQSPYQSQTSLQPPSVPISKKGSPDLTKGLQLKAHNDRNILDQ